MKHLPSYMLALVTGAIVALPCSADWLRFRGTNGIGVSDDAKIPTTWTAKKNVQWKFKMMGRGFSSPIVVGNKIFATCYTGGAGRDLSDLKRHLVCVDRNKGTKIWSRDMKAVLPEFATSGRFAYHGYASSTPVSDGERVYVLYGTTGVLAYDLEGKLLWKKSVGTGRNCKFGSGTSPIIYKDFVIVTAASESTTFYAFNKVTGKQEWKIKATTLSSCYGTPVIGKNDKGEDELLIGVADEVWSLNPYNGKLKWYAISNCGGSMCSSVLVNDGIVYAAGGGGFAQPACTAIRIGGKNDITKTNVKWSLRNSGPYVPSAVLYKDHIYWISNRSSLTCVNIKTGKEVKSKRLQGQYYASPIVINGKLYCMSRYDGCYIFDASPKLTNVAHNYLGDESDFSGTPAIDNGQMFLRSDGYLYCISTKQ